MATVLKELEDLLAHTRIGAIAAAVALALSFLALVQSLVLLLLYVVAELTTDDDRVFGSSVLGSRAWDEVIAAVAGFAAVAGVLTLMVRNARREQRACPDCLSQVPRAARVCRFCAGDLPTD